MWFLRRDMLPFREIERLEGTVVPVEHSLCVALKQQCQRSATGADINRLPKAIQHQHVLVEH